MTAEEKVTVVTRAAEEKKAADVVSLPLTDTVMADYFVVAAGRSRLQVQSIADGIEQAMDAAGVRVGHREGYDVGRWVLLDYGDVVVHVFSEEDRRFYNLERLWGEPTARQEVGVAETATGRP
jgi:ribosome-associated protein